MIYDEVIRNRQAEIFNEITDIEKKMEKLRAVKEQRIAEYNMLQHISERGLMDEGKKVARIDFEEAIKRIFNQAGRPLSVGELIGKLEEFGYIWSNYQAAWYRLRSSRLLEPTGERGYYNIITF